jgi:hypothetical protein
MTDIDLGFNPFQPRDKFGMWVHGAGKIAAALKSAEPGTTYRDYNPSVGEGVHYDRIGDGRVYTKRSDGNWDAALASGKDAGLHLGVHTDAQILRKHGSKGFVQTKKDRMIEHDQKMNKVPKSLRRILSDPYYKDAGTEAAWRKSYDRNLSTTFTGEEIDLDWTEWNRTHGKGAASTGTRATSKSTPAKGNSRAALEIKRFKASTGLKSTNGKIGPEALAILKRRAATGHLRAAAILAASRGNVSRANKIEAARRAKHAIAK